MPSLLPLCCYDKACVERLSAAAEDLEGFVVPDPTNALGAQSYRSCHPMSVSVQAPPQHQQPRQGPRRETAAEREKRALKKQRKESRQQPPAKAVAGCAAATPRVTKVAPRKRFGPQRIEQVKDGLPLPGTGLQLCRSGQLSALRARFAQGSWHPATTDRYGSTALMWAAGSGHVAVAAWLVEHGADVEARNKDGRSALMWAVRNAELEMCDWLVDRHGAALDAVREQCVCVGGGGGGRACVRACVDEL